LAQPQNASCQHLTAGTAPSFAKVLVATGSGNESARLYYPFGRASVSNSQVRRTQMKSLLWLSVVLLCAGVAAQSVSGTRDRNTVISNRLIGAWKLVSLEEPSADGHVHRADCTGMFVFTRDGKASVQVMYRTAQSGSTYAQGGYEASYGSYRIDDSSTLTFHVDGALVRALIGKDLKRRYEISSNRLIVKSTDANEHWTVVWERY